MVPESSTSLYWLEIYLEILQLVKLEVNFKQAYKKI